MASSAPVRVRLRYAAFETFIDKFAPNVTRGGVFLASREPRPVGEVFSFEIQLAGGEVALAGEGKVTWVKPFDPATPQRPHGMGVQFLSLDPPSRDLLNRILGRKAAAGAPGATPSSPHAARPTGPLAVTGLRGGANGKATPAIDTSVDLAAELGVDEAQLRRALDRAWRGSQRGPVDMDELEALLKPEPADEAATIAQALAELPRLLEPSSRRLTGALRTLGASLPPSPPPLAPPQVPAVSNGQDHNHDHSPHRSGE